MTGNAGDPLRIDNGMAFSARDNDKVKLNTKTKSTKNLLDSIYILNQVFKSSFKLSWFSYPFLKLIVATFLSLSFVFGSTTNHGDAN